MQCQNIFKQYLYEHDHMLEKLDMPAQRDFTKLQKEVVPPFHVGFPQKVFTQVVNMQEFLEQQYPAPFCGAQRYKEKEVDKEPYKQYLSVERSNIHSTQDKFRKKQISDITQIVLPQNDQQFTQPQIQAINESYETDDLSMENLMRGIRIGKNEELNETERDLNLIVQNLNRSLNQDYETKLTEKLTLPQILGLDTQLKRDAYRALPLKQQKEVVKNNLLEQYQVTPPANNELKNAVLQSSSGEMNKNNLQTKINFFKIINELDILKKGVRDIKNKTRQTYALRKKAERSPDIQQIIKQVKDTVWYTPGFLDQHLRDGQAISLKNNFIDNKHNVEEQDLESALGEVQSDLNEINQKNHLKVGLVQKQPTIEVLQGKAQDIKQPVIKEKISNKPSVDDSVISSVSNASRSTKKSVDNVSKIQISRKAQQMAQYLQDDIF